MVNAVIARLATAPDIQYPHHAFFLILILRHEAYRRLTGTFTRRLAVKKEMTVDDVIAVGVCRSPPDFQENPLLY
jgi:hypothetical protein